MEITNTLITDLEKTILKARLNELKKYFYIYDRTGLIGRARIAKLEKEIKELEDK